MMRRLPLVLTLLGGCCMVGCHAPKRAHYVSTAALHAVDASAEADALWSTVQDTLRGRLMPLDRVDRRAGVITTLPVMSQHWFEFWRSDVATREDAIEATLNPIRRWVEVTVALDEARNWTQLSVRVHKQRLSSPDRQFNSSGAAYQYFGESLPSTMGDPKVTAEADRWIDIGRDPAMEELLLNEMLGGMSASPSTASDPDTSSRADSAHR